MLRKTIVRVLVAEDEPLTAEIVGNFLTGLDYEVTVARDGREAFRLIRNGGYRIVISDWEMPEMSGLELCRRIRSRGFGAYIYIILLTSHSGTTNLIQGLNAGADDFVTKPFQPGEFRVRLRVAQRVLSLESRDLIIFSLAKLAESRDPETGAHLERIREYSRVLVEELATRPEFQNQVDGDFAETIYLTSPLHDIGKVGIPDRVLLKPGALSESEFEIMKQHTVVGSNTLSAAVEAHPNARFLRMARDIAWTHHERFDGNGYPRGLAGEDIPLCGRIVAVADVYDALTTKRVYKPAFSHEKSRSILVEGRGRHFDPFLIDAFLAREADFTRIRQQFSSENHSFLCSADASAMTSTPDAAPLTS
jgi:putative two-component system response regulator